MPICYYICASKDAKKLVKEGNLLEIDNFIARPSKSSAPFDGFSPLPNQTLPDNFVWIYGAYQIANAAIVEEKADILNHIGDKICFDFRYDGNSYDLFVLAVEDSHLSMIDILWKIACNNGYYKAAKSSLEWASQRLIYNYSKLTNDPDIINVLPILCNKNISLEKLYTGALLLHLDVAEWLLQNYYIRIDPRWTLYTLTDTIIQELNPSGLILKHLTLAKKSISKTSTSPSFTNPNNLNYCTHGLILSTFNKGPYQFGNWKCDICQTSHPTSEERWNCNFCLIDQCILCCKDFDKNKS